MSYDSYDAWLDEEGKEHFDFELLELGDISPRPGIRYLDNPKIESAACLDLLFLNLMIAFGSRDDSRFNQALGAVTETAHIAMDVAEQDAREAFYKGEDLDDIRRGEGPYGLEQPARTFIHCLDSVGLMVGGFSEQELCAALGLYLLGNLAGSDEMSNPAKFESWSIGEVALLLAKANWYRGKVDATLVAKQELSARNRQAATVSHDATNRRKEEARKWYVVEGRMLPTKAAAAEIISERHSCAYEVAKRWIVGFDRAATRPHPKQER